MKLDASSFVANKKEVTVPNGEGTATLFVHELGYLQVMNIYRKFGDNNPDFLPMMVVESVTDPEGNRFTIDEVRRLKKSVAEPLFDAVVEVNNIREAEKN